VKQAIDKGKSREAQINMWGIRIFLSCTNMTLLRVALVIVVLNGTSLGKHSFVIASQWERNGGVSFLNDVLQVSDNCNVVS
jgi:hypothetical protein